MTQAPPESTEMPRPEDLQWAMTEASKDAMAVAPGWFRAWPTADEKWSVVNVRAATQLIVNHSREDERHPHSWTVRALFGDKAVELHVGPYESRAEAILVAHAILSRAFGEPAR
jgi:hypothetical protein